jgi:hypothetical protein
LLKDEPLPDAIISLGVVIHPNEALKQVYFSYGFWKNAELTRAWREKFARPADGTATFPPDEAADWGFRRCYDPAPFEAVLREVCAGKSAGHAQFQISWAGNPVVEHTHPDEDN